MSNRFVIKLKKIKKRILKSNLSFEDKLRVISILSTPPKNQYMGFQVRKHDTIPYDINFSLNSSGEVPKDAFELYKEIENMTSKLKKIFKNDKEELDRNFELLLSLAQAGLVKEIGNPKSAKQALENLKFDILTVQGKKLKSEYIRELGTAVFLNTVILTFVYLIFKNEVFSKYILVFMGAMIGSWVSFCIRKLVINFDDLVNFEKDLMPFQPRLVFIGSIALIFAMLLNNDILSISFGTLSLKTFLVTVEKNILFGILCGILDMKLATNLYEKTELILNIKEGKSE